MARGGQPGDPPGSRIKLLAGVPLLADIPRKELRGVLALGKEVEFPRGGVIVKAGDQGRDFYLLLQGNARLTVPGRRTATLTAGDYFGEMSVLDGEPRSATIEATTRVSALRFDRPAFIRLLDSFGVIGRKILVEVSQRLRAAEETTGRR
jgi:CRP/FNR family cyclic AMP-dependent transcriptional regulator